MEATKPLRSPEATTIQEKKELMETTEPLLSPISVDAFTSKQKSMFRCAAQRWILNTPFKPTMFEIPIIIDTDLDTKRVVSEMNEFKIEKGYIGRIQVSIKQREKSDMQTWLNNIGKYLLQLPFWKKFTILGYTRFGDVYANNVLRNMFDRKKFQDGLNEWETDCKFYLKSQENKINEIVDLPYFFPLYFQALQALQAQSNTKSASNTNVNSSKVSGINANKRREIQYVFALKGLEQYIYFGANVASILPIETFWIPVIHRFIKDLNEIINGSPPLPCDIRLFRGIKPDGFKPQRQTFRVAGFLSTTSMLGAAQAFIDHKKGCCIQEITVSRGVHTLPLAGLSFFPNEKEFVFGSDTILYQSPTLDNNIPYIRKVAIVQ